MTWQDTVTDILNPPTSDVTALLGWVAFLCLSAVVWLMRVREKERKAELEEWRTLARARADELRTSDERHHEEIATERKDKESMAREVIELLQSTAQTMTDLRNDARELEKEHRDWREEVRGIHDACLAEVKRLSALVDGSRGPVPGDPADR